MSRMGRVAAQPIEWYAARMLPLRNAGRRKVRAGGREMFTHELLLRRRGFEVFVPVRREWRVTDRHRKTKSLVDYPLLTNWLFLGWPEGAARWADLADLGVVRALLGDAGRPARIGEAVMQDMMRRWGGGHLAPEHHRYLRTHAEFAPGDTVRVIDGPCEGHRFEVQDISERGVRGVIALLGRSVEVDFAPAQVEVVDSLHRYRGDGEG